MREQLCIENCYRQLYQGMVSGNRGLLVGLLDDCFVLIHMTGKRQSKEDFIRAIEDGTLCYYSAEHESMTVKLCGEKAKLTGQSIVNAAVFGGGRHTWRLQLDLQLAKKDAIWTICKAEASTY